MNSDIILEYNSAYGEFYYRDLKDETPAPEDWIPLMRIPMHVAHAFTYRMYILMELMNCSLSIDEVICFLDQYVVSRMEIRAIAREAIAGYIYN